MSDVVFVTIPFPRRGMRDRRLVRAGRDPFTVLSEVLKAEREAKP